MVLEDLPVLLLLTTRVTGGLLSTATLLLLLSPLVLLSSLLLGVLVSSSSSIVSGMPLIKRLEMGLSIGNVPLKTIGGRNTRLSLLLFRPMFHFKHIPSFPVCGSLDLRLLLPGSYRTKSEHGSALTSVSWLVQSLATGSFRSRLSSY